MFDPEDRVGNPTLDLTPGTKLRCVDGEWLQGALTGKGETLKPDDPRAALHKAPEVGGVYTISRVVKHPVYAILGFTLVEFPELNADGGPMIWSPAHFELATALN